MASHRIAGHPMADLTLSESTDSTGSVGDSSSCDCSKRNSAMTFVALAKSYRRLLASFEAAILLAEIFLYIFLHNFDYFLQIILIFLARHRLLPPIRADLADRHAPPTSRNR